MEKKKLIKVVDIIRTSESRKTKDRTQAFESEEKKDEVKIAEEELVSPEIDWLPETTDRESQRTKKKPKKVFKRIIRVVIAVGLLVVLFYLATSVLPKVDIKIFTKKVNWSFEGAITANKNINQIDADSKQIPAEVLTKNGNQVFNFTPTGKKSGENKAKGTITIINNFGTSSQPLVATTRFQTADGKIFRLISAITVPPAKMVNGKLQPSSVNAQVIADKAGPDYNVGPQEKFTIPGFQGTEKYNGFYARSDKPMTGGAIGEVSFATEEDVTKAQSEAETRLKEALLSGTVINLPEGFLYLKDADNLSVTKKTTDASLNENGQFSVFVEGQISIVAFKESDLLQLLKELAFKENVSKEYFQVEKEINYQKPQIDWKAGKMEIPLKYSTVFSAPLDVEKIKREVVGKKETELKSYILSLAGIDKLNVSFWPFWVKSVPNKQNKVNIAVE
ncbi:MAG: hypothetical protein UV58_C0017G0007 [Candidatus Wolfebacteria bacterium GW2011_GWC1_43_10]|uniref:Baseplate protein J-like domain-containing protein n=1 Tax=Candidatus Wolfebacteria bacterium GW2011_GWC1_43_10 TaxID=1619011 RepID=A0A0G1C852_9BACT|nr:MAG: hypothetical protein UV58_C0017G0007 [Candidatus Wolfebacteria bacterium GW2011_GWC1_43_10]